MRFESTTTSDGVGEQDVTLDGIPGVLWSRPGRPPGGFLFPSRFPRALADSLYRSLYRLEWLAGQIRGKLEYIFLFQVEDERTTRVENRANLFYRPVFTSFAGHCHPQGTG